MEPKKKLDAYFWGFALVWAGLVFGGESLGMLPQIGNSDTWSWIFLGVGLLSFLLNFVSLSSDAIEKPESSDWFWGGVFLILGIGGFTHVDVSWPLIIILIGAGMLVKALIKKE